MPDLSGRTLMQILYHKSCLSTTYIVQRYHTTVYLFYIMSVSKKIHILLLSIFAIVATTAVVFAGTNNNITGWGQSANIGWIKLNNCDSAGTCDTGDYGLNTVVPATKTGTSTITGYAWSSNIGWINFADATCPTSGCAAGAKVDWTAGKIIGWARACSVYATGCGGALLDDAYRGTWDGYIALNPKDAGGAAMGGLALDKTTGAISGYGWGSDVVGWTEFQGNIKIVAMCPDGVTPIPAAPGSCSCASGKKYNSTTNSCDILVCTGGQVASGNACACPAGSALNGAGQCICSVGGQGPVNGQCPNAISCGSGQHANSTNDACLCDNGGSIAKNCVIPPTSCPTGQKLDASGNSCICNDGTAVPTTGANAGMCPKKTPKYIES